MITGICFTSALGFAKLNGLFILAANSRAFAMDDSTAGSSFVLLGVLGFSFVNKREGLGETIVTLSLTGTKVYFLSLFALDDRLNALVVLNFSMGRFRLYSFIVSTFAGEVIEKLRLVAGVFDLRLLIAFQVSYFFGNSLCGCNYIGLLFYLGETDLFLTEFDLGFRTRF